MKTSLIVALVTTVLTLALGGCERPVSTSSTPGNVPTEWEAALPKGAETDLIQLNLAAGNKKGADYIKSDVKEGAEVDLKPFVPDGLKPKASDLDGLVIARPKMLPPDMLGAGSFYLIKHKDTYYRLTAMNFARLFGPAANQAEILPLVTLYEKLFGNPFAEVITTREAADKKDAPPDVTKVTATRKGFEVRLILHNGLHHAYFAEKHLLVHPDGIIEVTKEEKVVKDLGPGYFF